MTGTALVGLCVLTACPAQSACNANSDCPTGYSCNTDSSRCLANRAKEKGMPDAGNGDDAGMPADAGAVDSGTCQASTGHAGCQAGMAAIPGGCFNGRTVNAFCMDLHEVTFADYSTCAAMALCPAVHDTVTRDPAAMLSESVWLGFDVLCNARATSHLDHPMNCLEWSAAAAYCVAVHKRLPTDAEWEWSARRGAEAALYPWGAEQPDDSRLCWSGDAMRSGTCTVSEHPAGGNAWGVLDLGGNVAEFTAETFQIGYEAHHAWGGSWDDELANKVGRLNRQTGNANIRANIVGFRCVVDR